MSFLQKDLFGPRPPTWAAAGPEASAVLIMFFLGLLNVNLIVPTNNAHFGAGAGAKFGKWSEP